MQFQKIVMIQQRLQDISNTTENVHGVQKFHISALDSILQSLRK
jgi:hypothetical protein